MRITLLSDLHMEFHSPDQCPDPGEGDVLILAGDIILANELDKYEDFFLRCVRNYNKVFYVLGNHEFYGGDIEKTYWDMYRQLPAGIELLQNSKQTYEGVTFIGATLWADMDNADFTTMCDAQDVMTDYRTIKNNGRDLTVLDTMQDHYHSRQYLEKTIPTIDGPVVVITHHAPSQRSVHGHYIESKGAYSTDMEQFIRDNKHIHLWCHGHIHHTNLYTIGNTHIMSNPRGYSGMETNPRFNRNTWYQLNYEPALV